jgi:hypothetical protein
MWVNGGREAPYVIRDKVFDAPGALPLPLRGRALSFDDEGFNVLAESSWPQLEEHYPSENSGEFI